VLDWKSLDNPLHYEWFVYYQRLLALRHKEIVPRLQDISGGKGTFRFLDNNALETCWVLGDGARLTLIANLDAEKAVRVARPAGEVLFESFPSMLDRRADTEMPPWSVIWFLKPKAKEKENNG
jgi:1,4-alpha-glucan branching enzyme/maltooligosyltrehalose trehalohydrolase